MKTLHYSVLRMIVLVIIIIAANAIEVKSQALLKLANPYTVTPFIESNGNLIIANGSIGIGVTSPTARLHVKLIGTMPTNPLFKTEVTSNGITLGSIQNCVSLSNQSYGIYQTGQADVLNYFQNPVKISKVTICDDGNNGAKFSTDQYVTSINFSMNATSGPVTTPLSVNGNGIRVRSNLVTDNFQLLTNPGVNKILTSDVDGNGTWADLSRYLTCYWKQNGKGDIYRDSARVGIGTSAPTQKLEVSHSDTTGGIVINQMADSIYTNEIRFNVKQVEQWAIGNSRDEYERDYFFVWSDISKTMNLFIDGKNGMTGIGTVWPSAKLEVAGDFMAETIGIGMHAPDSASPYKLYVEGGIAAREVKVTINNFPDYCFDDDYKLMRLSDLRTYISENKHLPEMPTAKEIEEQNGIELGAMQTLLVKKVEEQTLYILDLQKQLDEMKTLLDNLTQK